VSFFVLTIGTVGVCFDRFVRSRSNTKTKRSYSHGISSSILPINFLRSAPTSARTHIIWPRRPKQAHPQKRDRSDAMLSRSNSSVIFSPRRGYRVLAGVFGLKIDDVTETSKASEPVSKASKHKPRSQDQYSYVYTSDDIEVLQPQQKPKDVQLVATESNNESPYSMIDSRSRESGLSVRDVPERWGLVKADDSKVPPSFSKPPTLPQRRGRHIAPLNNAIYGESDNSIGTPLTHMQVTDPPIRNDYSLVKEIGAGGEGQCSLLMRKRDSQLRVVKTVKRPHKYGGKPVEGSSCKESSPTTTTISFAFTITRPSVKVQASNTISSTPMEAICTISLHDIVRTTRSYLNSSYGKSSPSSLAHLSFCIVVLIVIMETLRDKASCIGTSSQRTSSCVFRPTRGHIQMSCSQTLGARPLNSPPMTAKGHMHGKDPRFHGRRPRGMSIHLAL